MRRCWDAFRAWPYRMPRWPCRISIFHRCCRRPRQSLCNRSRDMPSQTIEFHQNPAQSAVAPSTPPVWPVEEVLALFDLPFNDLLYRAQQVHREHFDPSEIELATLLSIKTGGCPEDCGYCPQAARYDTGVTAQKMLPLETVLAAAREAKAHGA